MSQWSRSRWPGHLYRLLEYRKISKITEASRRILPALGLAVLAGCSYLPELPEVPRVPYVDRIIGEEGMFRDRKEDYLEAETLPRIQVPSNLDSFIIDDLLIIPELPQNNARAYPDAPRPLPMEGRSERQVVIQRMRDQSWIVADASPSQVWPRIRDYWRQAGIPVAFEDPGDGIMETGWFVLEDNVLTRERLQISVETGFQNNSSEIRLLHMSAPQALPAVGQVNWPAESTDPTIAYDYLVDLSVYLVDVADLYQASSVSFLAGSLSSQGKAHLESTAAGNPVLALEAPFDRSWAAVRRALSRSGVEITGEDDGRGIIDILYDPAAINEGGEEEEDKPGLLRRLVTLNGLFSRDDKAQHYALRLQLLETADQIEVLAMPLQGPVNTTPAEIIQSLMQLLKSTIA